CPEAVQSRKPDRSNVRQSCRKALRLTAANAHQRLLVIRRLMVNCSRSRPSWTTPRKTGRAGYTNVRRNARGEKETIWDLSIKVNSKMKLAVLNSGSLERRARGLC